MGRRSQPRDANITAAANVGKPARGLNSKLSIEGNFSSPPLSEDTLWDAAMALTFLCEKRGLIDEATFKELVLAYGLDVLHKPKTDPPPAGLAEQHTEETAA